MSHFTVMVRVPAATKFEDLEAKVAEILKPYDENNEAEETFVDKTDECRLEYENEGAEKVFLPGDPTGYSPWDDRFKVPGRFGISFGRDPSHVPPPEAVVREVPYKELYPTFEAFCTEWHEYKPREDGRVGYMSNDHGYWDWYEVGGRWRGLLPYRQELQTERPIEIDGHTKAVSQVLRTEEPLRYRWNEQEKDGWFCEPGKADACRIEDLDRAEIGRLQEKRFQEFLVQYDQFLDGKDDWGPFDGPRQTLLRLGLIDCLYCGPETGVGDKPATGDSLASLRADIAKVAELESSGWIKKVWGANTHSPGTRCDMTAPRLSEGALRDKIYAYFNPVRTFAYVDEKGWRQPGKMGWFGSSGGGPEDYLKFAPEMIRWLGSGDQRDWVVVVDCHT